MQCEEFEDRFQQVLDARQSPHDDPLLVKHALGCSNCQEWLESERLLFKGLAASQATPRDDFAECVLAEVAIQTAQARPNHVLGAAWMTLLASAVCIAYISFVLMKSQPVPVAQPIPTGVAPANSTQPTPQVPIAALPQDESLALHSVSTDAQLEIDQYRRVLADLATQIGESHELEEMSESLSPGIRPIQSSFGLAIDALRRTLPGGRDVRPTKPDSGAQFVRDIQVVS